MRNTNAKLICQIDKHINLYKDMKNGIAFITNGDTGDLHGAHPCIDKSGSVKGMKNIGYWKKDARSVRSNGLIYNISECLICNSLSVLDIICAAHCTCGGNHKVTGKMHQTMLDVYHYPGKYILCTGCNSLTDSTGELNEAGILLPATEFGLKEVKFLSSVPYPHIGYEKAYHSRIDSCIFCGGKK